MNPSDVLRAAAQHMEDRAATYDAPSGERSMRKAVDMFNILKGDDYLTTELGWLFMAILKMVRSQQGDFKADNYEDMAAYCALAAEEAEANRVSPPRRPGEVVMVDRAGRVMMDEEGNSIPIADRVFP
jgi:hypothetical protein